MNFTIVICTYNRAAELWKVLGQLTEQTQGGFSGEILVVDNCSTDRTQEVTNFFVEKFKGKLRYLREDRPGKPFALNRAIHETKTEWLIFTDDDVTLTDNWVESLQTIIQGKNVRCFFGKIIPDWQDPKPNWYDARMGSVIVQADHGEAIKHRMNYLVGANMGIHRSIFERYGNFNESIKRFEDSEFSSRINKFEDIVYFPDLVVYHPVASARLTKKYFRRWYREMGRLMDLRLLQTQDHKLFGIPRWMYREFLKQLSLGALTIDGKSRFYHQLQVERMLGSFQEQWFPAKI